MNETYEGKNYRVISTDKTKKLVSKEANYYFNKKTGLMQTWGKTLEEDAEKFPAPTIADIEITTICSGGCDFCYKSNTFFGTYMTFETYKELFDKLPKSLTQIAFGADYDLSSNPDIWKIMEYTREKGVIPNITCGKATEETAEKLSKVCGAVAVSNYDKDVTYDSVKRLTDKGMTQVNIHQFLSTQSFPFAMQVMRDFKEDSRLKKLNAIVFLSLKQKGRGKTHKILPQEAFNEVVNYAFENDIPIGFDSCSSLKFFYSLNEDQYNQYKDMIMPCESTLESCYIDVNGDFYPCSFCENTEGWSKGINVLEALDFVEDVWNDERVNEFREDLLETKCRNKFGCRSCPIYNI